MRVSQSAEIRHAHLLEGLGRKEIARRLGRDSKTVRRALKQSVMKRVRVSPRHAYRLALLRERIEAILVSEPKVTAKRIGRLLESQGDVPRERALREHVSKLRLKLFAPEAFVHRAHQPAATSEFRLRR